MAQGYKIYLDKMLEECRKFPLSTNEPTMQYNYGAIMNILQKQEILGLVNDQSLFERTYELSDRFSIITQNILKGNWNESKPIQSYNRLQQLIEKELSSYSVYYLYAKQWGLSVEALYYYKNKEFNKAINTSIECIILNDHLIREGIYTLLFRAAEQNKNIVRVLFKKEDLNFACSYTRDFLDYLFNGRSCMLHGNIFKERKYWDEIPSVREGYAYDCFRAMISLSIHYEKNYPGTNLFSLIFDGLTIEVNSIDRQIIYNWIYLKKLYYSNSYRKFFNAYFEFMNTPINKAYDILKLDLFIVITRLIKKSACSSNNNLLEEIDFYVKTNLNSEYLLANDISSFNFVKLSH